MQNIPEKQAYCVHAATRVLGDKWSPKILVALVEEPLHFCQLQTQVMGITPRSLSLKLFKLIKMGILQKITVKGFTHKSTYELTEMGKDLIPILMSMVEWGKKYRG